MPAQAVDPANGVFLGEKRLAELPSEAFTGTIHADIPAGQKDSLQLVIRVKAWCPQRMMPNSLDQREIGIALFSLEMKAEGAEGRPVTITGGQ